MRQQHGVTVCLSADIGGMPGAGAAYNPDGSMRYMMDGGQQFTPPGKSYVTLSLLQPSDGT